MTQKTLQRFDFGTLRDFRGPIHIPASVVEKLVEEAPPAPPAPTFDEDQLQQARIEAKKLGYNEGIMAGLAQAQVEIDAQTQDAEKALAAIGEQVVALSSSYTNILKQQSLEVSELALMIAKKVAGEALKERSVEVIAALVVRCLPVLYGRPRITIELSPDTLPKAEQRLKEYLVNHGYEGDVQFRANPALAQADVRVDWASGLAERSTATLWHDIELLLSRIPLELEINPTPTTENTGETDDR